MDDKAKLTIESGEEIFVSPFLYPRLIKNGEGTMLLFANGSIRVKESIKDIVNKFNAIIDKEQTK
jgi:hypothetical protein